MFNVYMCVSVMYVSVSDASTCEMFVCELLVRVGRVCFHVRGMYVYVC